MSRQTETRMENDVTGIEGKGVSSRLDRSTPVPLHVQITEAIRDRIGAGEWPVHYRLKPEPELAEDLGVSRGTLRRALRTLIAEGLLVQIRGKGTFVTAAELEPALAQELTTLSEDFSARGIVTDVIVEDCRLTTAPRPVAALLDIAPQSEVLHLERIRATADGPVAYLVNIVRADLAPGIETTDFTSASLFGTLETEFDLSVATARRTFIAEAADEAVASALQVAVGSPVQYLQQVSYLGDGRAVEYSDVWINSSRLRVTSVLSRKAPRPAPQPSR